MSQLLLCLTIVSKLWIFLYPDSLIGQNVLTLSSDWLTDRLCCCKQDSDLISDVGGAKEAASLNTNNISIIPTRLYFSSKCSLLPTQQVLYCKQCLPNFYWHGGYFELISWNSVNNCFQDAAPRPRNSQQKHKQFPDASTLRRKYPAKSINWESNGFTKIVSIVSCEDRNSRAHSLFFVSVSVSKMWKFTAPIKV